MAKEKSTPKASASEKAATSAQVEAHDETAAETVKAVSRETPDKSFGGRQDDATTESS